MKIEHDLENKEKLFMNTEKDEKTDRPLFSVFNYKKNSSEVDKFLSSMLKINRK